MESTMKQKRGGKKIAKKASKVQITEDVSVKKKSKKKDKEKSITLDDIKHIGGTEDDLKLIADVSDDSDEENPGHSEETELDICPKELQSFIQSLGFEKAPPIEFDNDDSTEVTAEEADAADDEQPQVELSRKEKKAEKKKQTAEPAAGGEAPQSAAGRQQAGSQAKAPKTGAALQHAEVSSTSSSSSKVRGAPGSRASEQQLSPQKLLQEYVAKKQLLFEPEGLCYYHEFQSDPKKFEASTDVTVSAYRALAGRLFTNEVQIYMSRKKSDVSTKAQWMQTVVASGVLADKVAALTLQVQTAAVHSVAGLDGLLTMFKKKGRRETLSAMNALRQLFLQELLPEKRKLRLFSQHPFSQLHTLSKGNSDERSKRLILWFYEDQLKHKYQDFVATLMKLSHDTIPAMKQKAMTTSHELLVHKPEQEKALLTLIVNKIGDPDNKIAARAVHLLQKLVEKHTNMKGVVVSEVEALLYRANVSAKTQYYAVCFLNQLILSNDEEDLATKLIIVYFSFFKACMKKREADQKMLGAVLTGVNRAYPYSKVGDETLTEQTDALFKVVHIAPFNTSIQALLLLKQVLGNRQAISDRFYSALYSKVQDRTIEHSPRQAMYLNLLYQSLKVDTVIGRIKAFVKRLLQTCSTQQPTFVCGALFLVSELMDQKPALRHVAMEDNNSDDEEHFVDIDDEAEAGESQREKRGDGEDPFKATTSSWVHHQIKDKDKKKTYDASNRNPQFCGADGSVFWELGKLERHYHPSVALFAKTLCDGLKVHYLGNPLKDFTLMRFLDRFVYRNPKKQPEKVRVSVMEPRAKAYKPSAIRLLAVNTKDFLRTSQDKVPIDEVFFHKYFTSKRTRRQAIPSEEQARAKPKEDEEVGEDFDFDSDASSVDDDEFDRILDSMELDEEDDEDDDDLDFAGEVKRKKKDKTSKKKKGQAAEDDSSDDDGDDDFDEPGMEDDSDLGDEDFDFDEEEEERFKVENEEFDEEGFGDSDDEIEETRATKPTKSKKVRKRARQETEASDSEDGVDFMAAVGAGKGKGGKSTGKSGKKRRKAGGEGAGQGGGSLQATAEEFSSLMDENVGAKFDSIGLNAMANKDNADAKQLNWEMRRDKWIQGRDPKSMMLAKKRGKRAQGQPSTKARGHPGKKGGGKGKKRSQKRK